MSGVKRCDACIAFIRLGDDGKLVPHPQRGLRGNPPCGCTEPCPATPDEYPVGFDSEPRWVMNGGLPTLGRGHR